MRGSRRCELRSTDRRRDAWARVRAAQAELVAFGVGQHVPAADALANIDLPGAQRKQPVKLGALGAADRLDVNVQPVLGQLRAVQHRPEVNLERATVHPDRDAVAAALDNLPAQCRCPEPGEQLWVGGINDKGSDLVSPACGSTSQAR